MAYFQHCLNSNLLDNRYIWLVRNNLAVTFMKMKAFKEAKEQFMLILNFGEPIHNANVMSKIYGNLGVISMKSKEFSKAKEDFKMAIELE